MPDVTPGMVLTSSLFPPTKFADDDTTFTVSSDTFTTGGHPAVSFTFLTSKTGKVSVAIGGYGKGASATRIDLSYEIYVGTDATGTLVVDANAARRGASSTTDTKQHSFTRGPILHVLAVTTTHFIRLVHKKDGGTAGEFARRELWVAPAF